MRLRFIRPRPFANEGSVVRVLITGADGFVGQHLCSYLAGCGFDVRAAVRQLRAKPPHAVDVAETGDLAQFNGWAKILRDVDAVVHLVARTHMTGEYGKAALGKYRAVNVDVTRRLVREAISHGVQRFVFLSSIKAVGESSDRGMGEEDPCVPLDSYGVTKFEAEREIVRCCRQTDCRYTILRPPLVYGPGVRGNFLRLMGLVRRGIPLPVVNNRRSVIHVQNLVEAIGCCLSSPASRDQLFHVADSDPVSVSDMLRSMARGLGCPPRFVQLPRIVVKAGGHLLGRRAEANRIAGSLILSTSKIAHRLGWHPSVSTSDGIVSTCQEYRQRPWSADRGAIVIASGGPHKSNGQALATASGASKYRAA